MVTFILGMIWGLVTYHLIGKYIDKKTDKEISKNIFNLFREVLSNIKTNKTVFVSRVNQTVIFDTKISKYDTVNIVYLMDKQVVCIFKDNNCIYTTDSLKDKNNNLKADLSQHILTTGDLIAGRPMVNKQGFIALMKKYYGVLSGYKTNNNNYVLLRASEADFQAFVDALEQSVTITLIDGKITAESIANIVTQVRQLIVNFTPTFE